MPKLSGKTVIVTGGARGQGQCEVLALEADGAQVVVADVIDPVYDLPPNAKFHHLDITSPESWNELTDTLRNQHGRIHGLVNNAGIVGSRGDAGRLRHITLDDWNNLLAVNTTGALLGIQTTAPLMTDGGSIVNISSIAGAGAHMAVGYGVSKWALQGLSRIASMELGGDGIRVNAILPGYIQTPMQTNTPQHFVDSYLSIIPMGRTGRPDDIAPLVNFLISDDSSWISGADIAVDGGTLGHAGLKVVSDAMARCTGDD